jgi:hypothetical protein
MPVHTEPLARTPTTETRPDFARHDKWKTQFWVRQFIAPGSAMRDEASLIPDQPLALWPLDGFPGDGYK